MIASYTIYSRRCNMIVGLVVNSAMLSHRVCGRVASTSHARCSVRFLAADHAGVMPCEY